MRTYTVLFLLLTNFFAGAQNEQICHKIAHVDVEYILASWDAVKEVDSIVYAEQYQYEKQFESTYNQYLKLEEAVNSGNFEGVVLEDKQLQFKQLGQRVQTFQYSVETALFERQQGLMKPLLDKVKGTINEVADEGGYDYVLSSTSGESSIVLFCRTERDDVTDQVLNKLGIK